MSAIGFQFVHGGVHLSRLGLWLDPHKPQTGKESVFVSHAHSDHVAAHCRVILSEPTARLMRTRVRGERAEHLLPFGKATRFDTGEVPFHLTLLAAGHIFGSAMAFIEAEGESLLYTGDFKLRPSLAADVCEPRQADVLIMETTYGRPQYKFPPSEQVLDNIVRFCRQTIEKGETPILFGYSLGRSQELLRGLANADLPIMVHEQVEKLTRIYEHFGQQFPPYERYEPSSARGKVLIWPANANKTALLQSLGPVRTAVVTGWALDTSCKYRYQVDAAFPLSDHADFPDLIEMVKRVAPKRVYTLHGFAADFATTLRDMGFDARALGVEEQLTLALR